MSGSTRRRGWLPLLCRGAVTDQLGPVFEVHRIVMKPLPAPDKTVPLEDLDNLGRYRATVRAIDHLRAMPVPVVGARGADIDGRAPAMHARFSGIGDGAAFIGSGRRVSIPL